MSAPTHGESLDKAVPYVWIAVAFVVLVFAYGLTPWDAIGQLIIDQGVGDETAGKIAFTAGYTLPMTVGFVVVFILLFKVEGQQADMMQVAGICLVILIVAGVLSHLLGLGQILDLDTYRSGPHPALAIAAWVLSSYFNFYGFGLSVSSLAIAGATSYTIHAKTV